MSPLGMEPGLLREHVEILEKTEIDDGQGGRVTSWVGIGIDAFVWARIRPRSASGRSMADQAGAPRKFEVTIRSRDDVLRGHRLRWEGAFPDERQLELTSDPVNLDERGEYIVFEATEVAAE